MKAMNFHQLINRYMNYGVLNRFDKITGSVFPEIPFISNSTIIKNQFHLYNPSAPNDSGIAYSIQKYDGNNQVVKDISDFLRDHLQHDIKFAILHGSIATSEEIPYSDFDGLVVLKNSVFESNERIIETGKLLSKSHSLMMKQDSLQHHGWFVLCEKDLHSWPETFFPSAILSQSKSILNGEANMKITISSFHDTDHFKKAFSRLALSVTKQLEKPVSPNAYVLKGLLSEFMLLPALFVQAKTGIGVNKKESFIKFREYFRNDELRPMDEVSAIRLAWHNESNFKVEMPQITGQGFKRKQVKAAFDSTFYPPQTLFKEMLSLVQLLRERLK